MNLDEIKKISIPSYLQSIGCEIRENRNYYGMYQSPYRSDTLASLKVDYNKNLWYDFGTGEGGSIIDLVMKVQNCSFIQAVKKLQNKESTISSFSFHRSISTKKVINMKIEEIKKIEDNELLNYLSERKINLSIAKRYCLEIHYINQNTGKKHFGVAFKNDSDNYEVRWRKFKGCIGENSDEKKKDITFIRNDINNNLLIFEGFFDFLSYLTLYPNDEKDNDYIILNGLTMVNKTHLIIQTYSKVLLYLDNDEAGENATNSLISKYSNCIDQRYLYKTFKDLNMYL